MLSKELSRNTEIILFHTHLLDDIKEKIKDIQEKFVVHHDTITSHIKSSEETIQKQIVQAINDIPKPKIPSISEITSIIEQKIEPCSLDAKNGQLRSFHCENKIMIMEKKIENLFLLIQKYPVSQ